MEFLGHRDELAGVIDTIQARRAGIAAVLETNAESIGGLPQESWLPLFRSSLFVPSFSPSNSALEAVLSTNVLERIPDLELRGSVAAVGHYASGRYSEAEPLFERSLTIREGALGPDHLVVALNLNTLAVLYEAQVRYLEAEPLYERALAIREASLGPGGRVAARRMETGPECRPRVGLLDPLRP